MLQEAEMIIDYGLLFQMIAMFLGYIFPFWPLIILTPLQRRKHIVYYTTVAWGMLALFWLASLFAPYPITFRIIPEPFNSVAFFSLGIVLIGFQIFRRYQQRREIQIKAGQAKGIDDLHRLSPTDFENMVVEYYTMMGHKAHRTGAIGDHGVDVIIQAKNGEKWVVQCKRWRGSVGEPIIRDFYGVMQHEKADKGAIVTTGKFTPQAKEWAKGKPISLVEGDTFLSYLKKAQTLHSTAYSIGSSKKVGA
jgi:HJR/Mrr/RecB family endonuclease